MFLLKLKKDVLTRPPQLLLLTWLLALLAVFKGDCLRENLELCPKTQMVQLELKYVGS